jgi:ESCRT-II complex subunit VPS36
VVVVQGSQFSDAQLCKSLAQLLQTTPADEGAVYNAAAVVPRLGPSLTASAVSAALSLPLTLAKEALLVGEAAGVLCRDDGPEGLRFFRNFYKEAQPVAF